MTIKAIRVSLFLLVVLTAAVARADTANVADVQVIETGRNAWLVRVTASGNQAFDRLPQSKSTKFVVRLHQAKLAKSRAPLGRAAFGTVALAANKLGVDVTITLTSTAYRVSAAQGESPNVVEFRVTKK